jgi:hypothetical protein
LKWDTFKHAHFKKVIQCDTTKGVTIVCFHPLVDVRMFNVIDNRLSSIKYIQSKIFNGVDVIMIGDFY